VVTIPLFGLGLGLTVIGHGLGVGLMKYWSRSHTFWSLGLKSIICFSSVITSDCVLQLLCSVDGHHEYFTSDEIVIVIDYSSFIISNMQ